MYSFASNCNINKPYVRSVLSLVTETREFNKKKNQHQILLPEDALHIDPSSGDSRIKKVGGQLRGQGKSREANIYINVNFAWCFFIVLSVAARGENGWECCEISSLVEQTGLSP